MILGVECMDYSLLIIYCVNAHLEDFGWGYVKGTVVGKGNGIVDGCHHAASKILHGEI